MLPNKIMVIFLCLFASSQVLAANVDFNAIAGNATEHCNANQTNTNCNEANKDSADCKAAQPKTNCVNAKAEVVEPKFSTKRPRGQ